jgi:hypothetical protein
MNGETEVAATQSWWDRWEPAVLAGFIALALAAHILSWISQFGLTDAKRHAAGGGYVANTIVNVVVATIILIVLCFMRANPWFVGLSFVYSLSALTQFFSFIYWTYGNTANFGQRLSHLDALNFTMGTLSTAGTGSLEAKSQLARRIWTLQMGLDIGLLLVAGTFVLSYVSRDRK